MTTPSSPSPHAAFTRDRLIRAMPVVFVLLWSTGFIGAKFGLPYAEPLTFLLIRFAALVAVLVPLAFLLKARWPRTWGQAGHIAVTGVLVHGGYLGGVFEAINHGLSAGLAALIVGLQPLLTAVVVGPFLGERVTLRQWGGFLLGLGGVGLVVGEKLIDTEITVSGLGLLLAVGALCAITFGTVYQKRYCTGMDLTAGSAIQFAAAGVVMLVLAPLLETMRVTWTWTFVLTVGWLVVVLSIGAMNLLLIMIRQGAVARVASFFYMVPPVTAVVAWALFDERLGVMALVGMAVAATGVALVVSRR